MKICILDASVGAKWFFADETSDKANQLFEYFHDRRLKLIVPELFFLEIGSACSKKVKRNFLTFNEANTVLQQLFRLPLEKYPDAKLADIAFENSLQYMISVYDGLYLALAETYVSPLVTADEKLYRALKGKFDLIELLKDFEISSLS